MNSQWNKIPDQDRQKIVEVAFDLPELSWSGPLLIGQFKFDYCITAYYQPIFVLAGDD